MQPIMAAEYGRSIWEPRDKEGNNGHEDLLVFGYSCKLFRDNDKALYLDKGNHLIPWMGDNSVMVDRYVRRQFGCSRFHSLPYLARLYHTETVYLGAHIFIRAYGIHVHAWVMGG